MTQLTIKDIQVDEEIASSLGLNKTTVCQNIDELTRVGSVLLDISKKEIFILVVTEEKDVDGDIYTLIFRHDDDILNKHLGEDSGYVSSGSYNVKFIKIAHLDYLELAKGSLSNIDIDKFKQDVIKIMDKLKDNIEEFKRKEKIKDKIKE